MNCRDMHTVVGCLTAADGSKRSIVIHYEYGIDDAGEVILASTRHTEADGITVITLATGDVVEAGMCEIPAEYDVYVVRLHGDRVGVSTAKVEGQGHAIADVGNTFTLGGSGPFPEYVSYSADWLGDTNQNGVLDWNGLGYRAGFGSGTAGYAHSRLPTLTESHRNETHTNEIVLSVDQDTFVELRFKVRKP